MAAPSPNTFLHRLDRLRAVMRLGGLDAFVVTHAPNLRYLTGLAASAGLAVVTRTACVLVVDFRYATTAGALVAARSDGAITLEITDRSYDECLVSVLRQAQVQHVGVEADSMSVNRFNRLSSALASGAAPLLDAGNPYPRLVPTEQMIERARMVKDDSEIAVLRNAAARLSGVAGQLPAWVRPGRTEAAIAGDIDSAMRDAGFEGPAFPTIVASGPNSALPHARPGSRILQAGESVVLDFGGVFDGYCVDLTRTRLLEPATPELVRIFSAVSKAQAAAIAAVRPGALPGEIDRAARRVLEGHGLGHAFGHGTGHGLGLEVHEAPRIARTKAGATEAPVEAGMVFTIEPGAYIPGLGGVRIEDDVLVIEGGCEVLTVP